MTQYSYQREHFRQYIKVATNSNVTVEWATLTDRIHLQCRVCDEALVCNGNPDPQSIDHSVQEWIKLHAHHISAEAKKKFGWGNVPVATDKDWGKAQIISDVATKYKKELDTQTDEALAKKIMALQAVTPEQKAAIEVQYKAFEQAKVNAKAVQLLTLAEEKQLKIKQQQTDMLADLQIKKKMLEQQLIDLTQEVEKKSAPPKALESKTGRKFR